MMRRVELPFTVRRPILACGADLKGSFALAKGKRAFLVSGFGDLSDPDNLARYEKSVKDHSKRFKLRPRIVACDMHPGYFSTHFAEKYHLANAGSSLYRVQHHEAHIASAIAEHSIKGNVIGAAFDGTGFGSDGNIWGGEFLIGTIGSFKRAAHLEYVPMPGGETAIREPWRMAASYLYHAFGYFKGVDKDKWVILKKMIEKGINSPLTSSAGRLFDAVGSMVLSKDMVYKEAELPMELEKIASIPCEDSYDFDIKRKDGILLINVFKMIRQIAKDIGKEKSLISARFHNTMADMIVRTALILSKKYKVKKVVLSGGVFQNKRLTKRTVNELAVKDLMAYTHSVVETNDSGIPIGQIAIANARTACV